MNKIRYACQRLIDSVWTLGYTIENGKLVIHSFDRDNPIGYEEEYRLPRCTLKEVEGRVVDKVYLDHSGDRKEYEVANKQFVFSYSA